MTPCELQLGSLLPADNVMTRLAFADIGFTRAYADRLRDLGFTDVRRHDLGWQVWWSGPWLSTRLVTAAKAASSR